MYQSTKQSQKDAVRKFNVAWLASDSPFPMNESNSALRPAFNSVTSRGFGSGAYPGGRNIDHARIGDGRSNPLLKGKRARNPVSALANALNRNTFWIDIRTGQVQSRLPG